MTTLLIIMWPQMVAVDQCIKGSNISSFRETSECHYRKGHKMAFPGLWWISQKPFLQRSGRWFPRSAHFPFDELLANIKAGPLLSALPTKIKFIGPPAAPLRGLIFSARHCSSALGAYSVVTSSRRVLYKTSLPVETIIPRNAFFAASKI